MRCRTTQLPLGIFLLFTLAGVTHAQVRPEPRPAATPEAVVTAHARGTFDVTLSPQDPGSTPEDSAVDRLMIDKRFSGNLEGTSRGQMLTAMTAVEGSAGYVAIERVSGTLHGRAGTFMLQHSGTMDRGAARLVISVVPEGHLGEPLLGAGLLRRESRVRHARRPQALRGRGPRAGDVRHPRLGREPHGLGQRNERDKVFAVFNFSAARRTVTFRESLYHGAYTEYFSGAAGTLDDTTRLTLEPWGYRVFVQ